MERLLLRFLLFFRAVWKRMGVDYNQFKVILETKLKVENRRPLTFGKRNARKSTKAASLIQFFLYLLMGAIFMLIAILIPDRFLATALILTCYISMLSVTVISDFSTILLDTKDQFTLLPRPVNDRTVAISRITFMGIKLFSQIFALALPVLLYVLIEWDIAASCLLLFQLILGSLVAILFVNGFYLVSLKLLPIQKFKDAISYIQIGLSLFIFLGYYIGPNLLQAIVKSNLTMDELKVLWFFPSTWIAAFQELLYGNFTVRTIIFSLLGIAVPALGVYAFTQLFSAGFNNKIAALAGSDAQTENRSMSVETLPLKIPLYKKIGSIICTDALEKAGFNIVWLITAKTREFKQQLYPSLAFLPIYFIFLFLRSDDGSTFTEKLEKIKESGLYIVLFYLSLLTILTVFQLITQSNRYKAAWIYYAAPIEKTGEFMTGVLKACLVKYFLPFNLLFLLVCIPLFGIQVFNDILLSSAVGAIESVLVMLFLVRNFPFSKANQTNSKALINILILGILGLLGYLHKIIFTHEILIWILALLAWVTFFLMLKYLKKEDWKSTAFDDE